MANYETLKSAIQQVVKTNGNNEITGALLQQTLLAMINSLGTGYQFIGVAVLTPTPTNPGTPEQNVFYIASEPGTYTNFSGIEIGENEVAVLKWNGSWFKDSTGAATQESVNQLGKKILSNFLNTDGIYFQVTKPSGAGVTYDVGTIPQGTKIKLSLTGVNSADNVNVFAISPTQTLVFSTNVDREFVYETPVDVSQFRITDNQHSGVVFSISRADSTELYDVKRDIQKNFLNSDGVLLSVIHQPNTNYAHHNVLIPQGCKIELSLTGVNSSDSVSILAYDSQDVNHVILSSANKDVKLNLTTGFEIQYFRITGNNNAAVTFTIEKILSETKLQDEIKVVKRKLESVDKTAIPVGANVIPYQFENDSQTSFSNRIIYYDYTNYAIKTNFSFAGIYLVRIPLYGLGGKLINIKFNNTALQASQNIFPWMFSSDEAPGNIQYYITGIGEYTINTAVDSVIDDYVVVPENAVYLFMMKTVNDFSGVSLVQSNNPFFKDNGLLFAVTKPAMQQTRFFSLRVPVGTRLILALTGVNASDSVTVSLYGKTNQMVAGSSGISGVNKNTTSETTLQDDLYNIGIVGNANSAVQLRVYYYYNVIGLIRKAKNLEWYFPAITDYGDSIVERKIGASVNGLAFKNNLANNILGHITYGLSCHDSTPVIVGNYIYIVYAGNASAVADNAGSPTSEVRMRKVSLTDWTDYTDVAVAKNGSPSMFTGGAGQPNIIQDKTNSDLLHIVFTAKSGNDWSIFTCDYSVANNAFSNYREVALYDYDGVSGTARPVSVSEHYNKVFAAGQYYSPQCNSTIGYYNGVYYIGLCMGNSSNIRGNFCGLFKTTNFTDWNLVLNFEDIGVKGMCEISTFVVTTTSPMRIIVTIRPVSFISSSKNSTYGAIFSLHLWNSGAIDREPIDFGYYKNASSRQSFFNIGNDLYLFTNFIDRDHTEIIKIAPEQLGASRVVYRFKYDSFHYANFIYSNDKLLCCFSMGDVVVSYFTVPDSITEQSITTKLTELFG